MRHRGCVLPSTADLQRSVAAAPNARYESPRFHLPKVRQAMGRVPMQQAIIGPTVIIHRIAAGVDHGVD